MVRQSPRKRVAVNAEQPGKTANQGKALTTVTKTKKTPASKAAEVVVKFAEVLETAEEKVEEAVEKVIEDFKPSKRQKRRSTAANSNEAPTPKKIKIEEPKDLKSKAGNEIELQEHKVSTPKKSNKRKKGDTLADYADHERSTEHDVTSSSPKRKPKAKRSKKTKLEEEMPLAVRTAISSLPRPMYIGAHVSGAGGVHNSLSHATHIGANCFALFLKSQRKWENPPLAPDVATQFHEKAKDLKFDQGKHVLPHGSYLVNLAQVEKEKADQAYAAFLDDLQRCEKLGIKLYNFHPGNAGGGQTKKEAAGRIAAQLNKSHAATTSVITVLENMAGQGNVMGSTWEDLRDIINGVDDKSRVGVCIDTCHTFAAGYDLRSPEAFASTMEQFDKIVGLKYLKALHLNDSKAPLGSHRDLHYNIGTGFLGLRAFHNVMNYPGFENLPMVLETPIDKQDENGKSVEDKSVWANEIKLLESLIGMDAESEEFKKLEKELAAKGVAERERVQGQVNRKVGKDAKKAAPKKKRKKKGETSDDEDDE